MGDLLRTLYDPTAPLNDDRSLHDVLGQAVLAVVDEPGFENVAGLCPPMRETRAVLGLKDYPVAIGVDWDGTLNRGGTGYDDGRPAEDIGPLDILFFRIGQPAVKVRDLGWERLRRSLADGLPILTTSFEDRGLAYAQTVFACSQGMSSEEDLEIAVRWTVRNMGGRRRAYRLLVCADPRRERVLSVLAGALGPGQEARRHLRILYRNSRERRELTTLPGYPFTGKLFGPWNIEPRIQALDEAGFERRREACRRFWETRLAEGMAVATPERRVNDAFRAWQVYNAINTRSVSIRGRRADVPHDGSGFYGDVYGITALSAAHALILTGRFRDAARMIESLLSYQGRDGLFLRKYGLCDNGLLLYVIGQQARFTGDWRWLRRLWPRAKRAADWVMAHRNRNPSARGRIEYGLLKGQYTADRTVSDVCYLSDAYNWLGLREIGGALAEAGLAAEANRLGREADAYRKDILRSMRRAAFPESELGADFERNVATSFGWQHRGVCGHGGLTVVPMTPVTRALEREFLGSHYYALVASELLETELLDVADPLYRHLVTYVERRGGLLLGMLAWRACVGIDHAYTYGYWLNQLREGNLGKVLLGFYGMLAYGMDRDTYAGTEITDLITGRPHYGGRFHYQPHTLSNTQQIRLLRMMLVKEEGDRLWLGFGAPRTWSRDLRVRGAATRWGRVSYAIAHDGRRATAWVDFEPSGPRRPAALWLKVRDPAGRPLAAVEVNGRAWSRFDAATDGVRLPVRAGRIELTAKFRPDE